jgi:GNAT superfamily N-acetyltransferase
MSAHTLDPSSAADVRAWSRAPYAISTDPSRLDVGLVHRFLTAEFWDTLGVTREVVERSIEHSLCFGIYDGERQVGFARVVTDRATFAFIADDFVVESHRGRGLATWLMQCVLSHPELQGLRRVLLVTRDRRLYLKAGFRPLEEPETYMALRRA